MILDKRVSIYAETSVSVKGEKEDLGVKKEACCAEVSEGVGKLPDGEYCNGNHLTEKARRMFDSFLINAGARGRKKESRTGGRGL